MQGWQQPQGGSQPGGAPWGAWSAQQYRGPAPQVSEGVSGIEQYQDAQEQEEGRSSGASSPSKSPLHQGRFADQGDQPLLRHRHARSSRPGGGDGMQLGLPQQHHPSSPPVSQAQYNRWVQQGADSRAADRAAAVGPGGRQTPNRRTLFAQQGQQHQSESTLSDGGSRQQAFAAASDPVTYPPLFDRDLPNMGDAAADQWQIPAMRAHTPRAHASPAPTLSARRGGPTDKTPGAVVKLGRRQAWLKYLAYEGCWQICLDCLMQGTTEEAREFLQNGCQKLRAALGLEALLLASMGSNAETSIYWDDKEEGGLTAVEIETTKVLQQPVPPPRPPPLMVKPPPLQPVGLPTPPSTTVQQAMPLLSGRSTSSGSKQRQGPCLEVKVERVVGCDALNPASTKQYGLVMYPSSKTVDSGAATLVSTDGSTHNQLPIELDPNLRQETLAVELLEGDTSIAMGTIQIAELHKLATQQDLFTDEAPREGFFKSLFPCLRNKGGHQSRMAWIKLVDNSGRTCGHAVLSARIVSFHNTEMGFLGPRPGGTTPIIEEVATLAGDQYPQYQQQLTQRYPQPEPQQQAQHQLQLYRGQQYPQPSYQQQEGYHQQPSYQQQEGYHQQPSYQQASPAAYQQPQQQLQQQRELVVRVDPNAAKQNKTAGGYLHVTSLQVYDELLASALGAAECGPRNLDIVGSWKWLLQAFATSYGVRNYYTSLSYLKWVVRPENATVTARCFFVLLRELQPLKQAQHIKDRVHGLTSGELGVLAQVSQRIEELLTQCFENYFMLCEEAATGMVEGALATRGQIPPVLHPAEAIFGQLRDPTAPADQAWLAERFKVAARKRFQGLLTATSMQVPHSPHVPHSADRRALLVNMQDSQAAINAYTTVEDLCKAIENELRADEVIKRANILPPFINLPELTSVEYVEGIINHLQGVLKKHPPPSPTEPAVRLVEAMGLLQDFVRRHEYGKASALLNSKEIFGKFVHEWIRTSYVMLAQRCSALEAGAPASAGWQDFGMEGKHRVAPLVEEMLSAIEGEMGRYERIITHWSVYGPDLEKCVTSALRDTTIAVSRQCGLINTKEGIAAGGQQQLAMTRAGASPAPRGGRTGWTWVTPQYNRIAVPSTFDGLPECLQQGINPNQALLMNSLRRLLAVSAQLEHRLTRWCGGITVQSQSSFQPSAVAAERIRSNAPNLSAQFAQMAKELRSEYYAAITLCAERLAQTLSNSQRTSVIFILRSQGLVKTAADIQMMLTRVMEELEKLLQWLSSTLDNRVFVSLTRGLWDLTSKDVLQYAEDLNEGVPGQQDAWRGRQNASVAIKVLDQFFKGALTASMGNDLHDKDLSLPAHSDRAHKLLAENLSSVNMSYDVY